MASTKKVKAIVYSPHPSIAMVQKWIAELPQKTGRSLGQWIKMIQNEGPEDEAGRRDWLKKHYDLGTNTAWWLAERSVGRGGEDDSPEAYLSAAKRWVDEMFAGPKASMRPLYEHVLRFGLGLGNDVQACPCKTIVPLYRKHVFAQLKPSTRTRLDLGLHLGNLPGQGRLIDTGGYAKKDRITHRIGLSSVQEFDQEVQTWFRQAYDHSAD